MARVLNSLCTTVSFAALALSATAAQAAQPESNLPPPDVRNAQASTSNEQTSQGDIVITGSRIRHNPLDLNAPRVFVDQTDIKKTGLNSLNEVLQRLPSASGGLNGKGFTFFNPNASRTCGCGESFAV